MFVLPSPAFTYPKAMRLNLPISDVAQNDSQSEPVRGSPARRLIRYAQDKGNSESERGCLRRRSVGETKSSSKRPQKWRQPLRLLEKRRDSQPAPASAPHLRPSLPCSPSRLAVFLRIGRTHRAEIRNTRRAGSLPRPPPSARSSWLAGSACRKRHSRPRTDPSLARMLRRPLPRSERTACRVQNTLWRCRRCSLSVDCMVCSKSWYVNRLQLSVRFG